MIPALAAGREQGFSNNLLQWRPVQGGAERQTIALFEPAQGQVEDLALLRRLVHQPQPTPSTARYTSLRMPRISLEEDVEAYLAMFERMAAAFGWPAEEWALRLLPLPAR
ncbi:hypothetical protein SKAU_G00097830 [Synaphobranchus kaupii]|uniref:Uncharacterized protein n=1 Tax=Synaphobranchus kaupii TaxID=118154 RepID=A0A9Q1FXZ1_SYNKA|nr:hypothetical protein SKAU_G00097830 [Synaphobranchus kaupii]